MRWHPLVLLTFAVLLAALPQLPGQEAKVVHTLKGHRGPISSLAYAPDGQTLASGSDGEPTVKLWVTATGKERASLDNGGAVFGVAFSADGKTLAAAGSNAKGAGEICLWDVATKQKKLTLPGGQTNAIHSVAFAPKGTTLAAGDHGGVVKLWDTTSGKVLRTIKAYPAEVISLAFSKQGEFLAVVSRGEKVTLWETASGKRLSEDGLKDGLGNDAGWYCVAFSPDGKTLATGGQGDGAGKVELWDVPPGTKPRTRWKVPPHALGSLVYSLAFSPDSRTLATGCEDRTVKLWDVATGKVVASFKHADTVMAVAFAPKDHILAAGGLDNTVTLREASGLLKKKAK